MRGKWPLGKRGFGIMKIQILSFPEQLSSEGTSFEVSHLLWGRNLLLPLQAGSDMYPVTDSTWK